MPVTDADLQTALNKVASLNEKIAEADLQNTAALREKEREITLASLDAEAVRLEAELASRAPVEPFVPVVAPLVVVSPPAVQSVPEQSNEETA